MVCWECGREGTVRRNIGERLTSLRWLIPYDETAQRCYCSDCHDRTTRQYRQDLSEYIRLKKKLMFERAVRTLERQKLDIYDYQEAIQAVGEFAEENPDKFDSSHEMMAAIVLIKNEIHCNLQYKVGRYQCDFHLPELQVILEIDGERHKGRKKEDAERDAEIRKALGAGWQIVHIKTEYLEQKAALLPEAIETVLDHRHKRPLK